MAVALWWQRLAAGARRSSVRAARELLQQAAEVRVTEEVLRTGRAITTVEVVAQALPAPLGIHLLVEGSPGDLVQQRWRLVRRLFLSVVRDQAED